MRTLTNKKMKYTYKIKNNVYYETNFMTDKS